MLVYIFDIYWGVELCLFGDSFGDILAYPISIKHKYMHTNMLFYFFIGFILSDFFVIYILILL